MKNSKSSVWPTGTKGVVPIQQMTGHDEKDAGLLLKMKQAAIDYLLSFPWCFSILDVYFGDGVGGIVAVFLVRIVPARPKVDEWLWVVHGDLPSAYFVTDDLKSPYEVLEAYIEHRKKWVKYASKGQIAPDDVLPVQDVPPTPEWARELNSRLDLLRANILPYFRKE